MWQPLCQQLTPRGLEWEQRSSTQRLLYLQFIMYSRLGGKKVTVLKRTCQTYGSSNFVFTRSIWEHCPKHSESGVSRGAQECDCNKLSRTPDAGGRRTTVRAAGLDAALPYRKAKSRAGWSVSAFIWRILTKPKTPNLRSYGKYFWAIN